MYVQQTMRSTEVTYVCAAGHACDGGAHIYVVSAYTSARESYQTCLKCNITMAMGMADAANPNPNPNMTMACMAMGMADAPAVSLRHIEIPSYQQCASESFVWCMVYPPQQHLPMLNRAVCIAKPVS